MAQPTLDVLKRRVLLAIMALSFVSTMMGWSLMEARGLASGTLRVVFGANAVFHPVMGLVLWKRLLPQRVVDLSLLCFASGICGACMALRLYSPAYGAAIDLQPLYLWIPVIYVFCFTLADHVSSLRIALANLGLFVAISLPYLVRNIDGPFGNFTIQLHLVSGALIAALYFFSSYLQRFQAAQLTVDKLARLANTDELTKVANRRSMTEAIEYELARYSRYGHPFSIVLFDIDRFKAVNDRFGHQVGDQVLVALADRAGTELREVDRLGRWGGEEFVVILPETGFEETLQKAGELCRSVAESPLAGQQITISGGVTSVRTGDTMGAMLQRADEALYTAKRLGRNRVEGVDEAVRSGQPLVVVEAPDPQ
jgi:diguanylate cyclase (GGDEF)-like protein